MIFKRFHSIYGKTWDEKFSDEQTLHDVMTEWSIGIAELTDEQIQEAISVCRNTLVWPPKIAEFINIAKPKNATHIGDAYRLSRHDRSTKSHDKALALGTLSKIKAALRGQKSNDTGNSE